MGSKRYTEEFKIEAVKQVTERGYSVAEVSRVFMRAQEQQMRRFKSPGQAQRFPAVHSQVHNLFRVGRHLLRAANYRLLRNRSFEMWQQVTCTY